MEQKTALITGASRGIGAATARRLARAGYAVAVNYCSSEDRALALVEELRAEGHTAMAVRADVSDPEQVQAMVDNVLDKFCQLDILVCNAGRSWVGLLGDMTVAEWRELLSVNLDSVFYCCKAVLPHMIHRKKGKIITVSSMWGQVGASCEAAYSASKAGVIGLTKALAKELGPSGIAVNCVAPGVIDTEMNKNLTDEDLDALREETPLERIGKAEDVAESVLFLASEGADFITGQVLCPNGGLII
ncbi:MAG: 3-oxoacyl-ACP reductase FabG [Pseudoflavonifractor capillosus]|uniref:elongation factor P 5-aminopentanone reductase n=1 Tax=Pseudoflavonifractor capillosus TaxID=106588 RepID=UPI0023F8358E|nr:3-oxoacyl-ACP reductase FabG [Pseudoflavonifractor capillosus]MCI5928754.1 3-oxoacyl-ACP reductase FabG [Pseudoflavonifractor capillosus]MDY4660119.1 3-oxoacyl-ACP reductase FabG [Pseudoflavonifractor capillosus]